jgi:N-acetylneuraminic acid mutarotase
MKRESAPRSAPAFRSLGEGEFFNPRGLIALLLLCVTTCFIAVGAVPAFLRSEAHAKASQRTLTFADRVVYQRAIEEVYWRHRIWPKERPDSKPPLDAVMSQPELEKKVEDYLGNSQALEDYWQRPITAEQLQAEMDRIAKHTRQPKILHELFAALGNDPFVIAECLARPLLAERLLASWYAYDERIHKAAGQVILTIPVVNAKYILPVISSPSVACIDDTWTPTSLANAPAGRDTREVKIWTGSEMVVWGGYNGIDGDLNTGGRYNPSSDSWTATSMVNAPVRREEHTAVWTGSEMIVWGGSSQGGYLNTGGRYNPSSDSWTATSIANAPAAREYHTAVWTGSQMIVWGGFGGGPGFLNTGGRYDPNTDSWTTTSTTGAPDGRISHTAVWTGSEMIVWGGAGFVYFNTGGRYNPSTDSWTATNTAGAPAERTGHTAVWTGTQMIVWGGTPDGVNGLNTGGRYNSGADSWTATSTANAPAARTFHTAVWAGSRMIVWGGWDASNSFNTGGIYNPTTNSWTATSTIGAPDGRISHTAVWTGNQMIAWGGLGDSGYLNTGGRYCAAAPSATPTPTPTASPSPTATPTPCTGRCTPTPRPRPTPLPRL